MMLLPQELSAGSMTVNISYSISSPGTPATAKEASVSLPQFVSEKGNTHTFTINLNTPQYVKEDIVRDNWDATGGRGVNYAERLVNNSADNVYVSIWKSVLGSSIIIDTKKETRFNIFRLFQNNGGASTKVNNITLEGSHDNTNFEHISIFL